jgi:hypothetical protein
MQIFNIVVAAIERGVLRDAKKALNRGVFGA